MDISNFVDNVHTLSDLELATLLCLVAKEHCLFETADELVDDLASELALVCICQCRQGHGLTTDPDRYGSLRPQLCCPVGRGLEFD